MKFIGFSFTKIRAEKYLESGKDVKLNSHVDFSDLAEEKINLIEGEKPHKLTFKYTLSYETSEKENFAELFFEGFMVLSLPFEESEKLTASWKEKKIPDELAVSVLNYILRKCSIRAVSLQDELNIPSPFLSIPKASSKVN